MVFGTTTFKCEKCGKRFVSLAAEWKATCFLTPMPCPECGSIHTYPAGFSNLFGVGEPGFYRKIWKYMEEKEITAIVQSY